MTKYRYVLLMTVLTVLGTGAAHAVDSVDADQRESANSRMDPLQRPGMQTRDGKNTWCDESGGGLTCYHEFCYEDDGPGQVSECDTWVQNTSNPD